MLNVGYVYGGFTVAFFGALLTVVRINKAENDRVHDRITDECQTKIMCDERYGVVIKNQDEMKADIKELLRRNGGAR